MRSNQTAEFIADRPYRNIREIRRAVGEHNSRVVRAPKDSPMAAEPKLTMSGNTVMVMSEYECHACYRNVGKAFTADSTTHRIVNRSGDPTRRPVSLCVPCWSKTVRYEGDDKRPVIKVRFG